MTLLIVGDPEDLTSAYVAHLAEARGLPVRRLGESAFGVEWSFVLDGSAGTIAFADGAALPLAAVSGAFVRFSPTPAVPPALADPALAETYARERRAALHALLDAIPAPVANRPGRGQANGSKPLQMAELAQAGFRVPAWIASNSPAAVAAFVTRRGSAIVKSCSGLRSQVRAWTPEALATLEGSCPVVVQERIGGHDVRLHTVGARAFATAVEPGPGVDYRHEARRGYAAAEAPAEVVARCVAFAAAAGLAIAGFDFKVADGTWWCLECNPVPTFLPYVLETGQPIAEALLDLLAGAR